MFERSNPFLPHFLYTQNPLNFFLTFVKAHGDDPTGIRSVTGYHHFFKVFLTFSLKHYVICLIVTGYLAKSLTDIFLVIYHKLTTSVILITLYYITNYIVDNYNFAFYISIRTRETEVH